MRLGQFRDDHLRVSRCRYCSRPVAMCITFFALQKLNTFIRLQNINEFCVQFSTAAGLRDFHNIPIISSHLRLFFSALFAPRPSRFDWEGGGCIFVGKCSLPSSCGPVVVDEAKRSWSSRSSATVLRRLCSRCSVCCRSRTRSSVRFLCPPSCFSKKSRAVSAPPSSVEVIGSALACPCVSSRSIQLSSSSSTVVGFLS